MTPNNRQYKKHNCCASNSTAPVFSCPMHPEVKQDWPGMCPECGMELISSKQKVASSKETAVHGGHEGYETVSGWQYTCPMHPEVVRDAPGICPECGMALVSSKKQVVSSKGTMTHDKHAGHSTNVFARKFWVSLALTVPIVLYSPLPQLFLGWALPVFPGSGLIVPLLGSIVFFYGGWIFLISSWRELKGKAPGMMTLISLAIIAAYVYSVFQVLLGRSETLFWELATLIVVMLLGHWLEMRAVKGAQGALQELSKLLPDTAEVEKNGGTETVALEQLKLGDVIVIRPGGKVAADGEIIEGESAIDEALATGESKPVAKKTGDTVIAGTINGDGSLRVKVTRIGDDTFLAGVMRLVQEAQASKSKL
ncbi:MAG: heavy metal-binding domain-containing protein, partial [Candidatus Andersenbacteria bacterium]|nr:heavy metal-binding domain-containing protein [Candidatus Andersenbacteria bacterium]